MSVLATPLASPLYEGAGSAGDVPGRFDCAINGMTFMFDTKFMGNGQFRRSSVPLLKAQQDDSGETSERSLNPEDLARQAAESWHHGAGQVFLDRPTSNPYRFRASKGIDPWDEWKAQLLPDTELARSSAESTVLAVVAGSRLYLAKGSTLEYTTDLTNWTTVTGTPGTAISSVASDGYSVYVACGASGLYVTNTGTSAASQLVSSALESDAVVGFVKGRLMVGNANVLYNVTSTSVAGLPTALFTHRTTAFRFTGFAAGKKALYAIGFAGDKTEIYRTQVKTDGSGLEVPIHAAPGLTDGEIGRSIYGYLDVIVLGTDKGPRFCLPDDDGDLDVGELIETGASVRCFEGQGRFIWFGWPNFDTVSTGLGRLDPTIIIGALAPAYSSDLMATAQGAVLSAVTFLNRLVFTVSGSGLWKQSDDLVAEGSLDSGLITHGLPDQKVAFYLTLAHDPLDGEIEAFLAGNDGQFTSLGSSSEEDATTKTLSAGEERAERFEVRLALSRSATDTEVGPSVTRWTLESNPAPGRGELLVVYLRLYDTVTDATGNTVSMDTKARYQALLALEQAGGPIAYQDAGGTATVVLDDHDFLIDKTTRTFFDGTFAAKLRRPRRRVT